MEELKNWLENIISGLVANPEEITISAKQDEQGTLFLVSVAKDDMGKIIGKHGNISNNIRSLLLSAGYIKDIRASMKIVDHI